MRWSVAACALACAVLLSACLPAATTPLSKALMALHDGDAAAFVAAKAAADAAKATAWQEGQDRCKLTPDDIGKYGEAALIEKLDHPDLFKLSQEARFLYTAKIVGVESATMKEEGEKPIMQAFLGSTSFQTVTADLAKAHRCPFDNLSGAEAGAMTGLLTTDEEERRGIFRFWMDELAQRHGEAGVDPAMRKAVAELDGHGFTADWPAKIELEEAAPQTFGQLNAKLDGH